VSQPEVLHKEFVMSYFSRTHGVLNQLPPYGVGCAPKTSSVQDKELSNSLSVLSLIEPSQDQSTIVGNNYISVQSSLEEEYMLLIPPLAFALWVWDRVDLEIGEAAVVSAGHPLSALLGQVALWYGACPVIRLGEDQLFWPNCEILSEGEQEEIVDGLRSRVGNKPGFDAVGAMIN